MPLPMTARKALKDAEKERDDKLAKIASIVGKKFDYEFDQEAEYNNLKSDHQKQQVGKLYYEDILYQFTFRLTSFVEKNKAALPAFLAATSANKIVVKTDPAQKETWKLAIQDGKIVVSHPAGDLGDFTSLGSLIHDIQRVLPTVKGELPATALTSLADFKRDIDTQFEKLKTALGHEFTAPNDAVAAIYEAMTDDERSGRGLGYYYKEILYEFAKNVQNNIAKDDMVKEAFNEATAKHIIRFKQDAGIAKDWTVSFANGEATINFKKINSNIGELSYYNMLDLL